MIPSATDTSSAATNAGGGSVTITSDPVADACTTPMLSLSGNPESNRANTYDVQLVVPSGAPAPTESVVVSDCTQTCDAAVTQPERRRGHLHRHLHDRRRRGAGGDGHRHLRRRRTRYSLLRGHVQQSHRGRPRRQRRRDGDL